MRGAGVSVPSGWGVAMVVIGLALMWGRPVSAQEVTGEAAAEDSVAAPDSLSPRLSPAGAFLRGAIIPGWGHAATGSLTRGAFYFGIEAAAGWMVFKTWRKLGVARNQVALWEERVTARLMSEGITDQEEIDSELEQNEEISRLRGLVDSRSEQREDWAAVAIFFLLMSGVDAFVSAHLQDFPEPLTVEGDPGGTISVAIRVPIG